MPVIPDCVGSTKSAASSALTTAGFSNQTFTGPGALATSQTSRPNGRVAGEYAENDEEIVVDFS